MLKKKELTVFSSLTQNKGAWPDSDETNLPVSHYEYEVILCLPEQSIKQILFCIISQTTLYTFSRNEGAHDNGGGSGWSLEGKRSMMNYTKNQRQ
jgi:hypothetical protein